MVMSDEARISEVRNTWEAAAPGWAKWEKTLSRGLEPATDVLLDMARVGAGARVLDIASGAGHQTLQAARRVGSAGTVVASDISATMLDNVLRNASAAGLSNVTAVESAAENLSAAEAPYDAAICRLGLMLFPGPSAAVSAVRRVLKPGGKFAALVFTTPANNPFMAQPMSILLRHAGKKPPGPGHPGIFALGGEGVLEHLLSNGGLTDVDTKTVRAPLKLGRADDALELIQQAFGAYRAVIADLAEDKKAAAWSEVLEALKQFEGNDGFETEFEFVIGSGSSE
jgi:ubiquinone/menaquinone biosynthesis C-methylase UbiE